MLSLPQGPVVLEPRVVVGAGGGPEKTILNTPRFMHRLGYPTICVYMHPPGDPGREVLAGRAAKLGAPFVAIEDRGPFDFSVVKQLWNLCRQYRVQIWHGHDYKSNVLGLLLARVHAMRLVTTVHGWGHLIGRIPLYAKLDRWAIRFYERVFCVSPDLYKICRKLNRRSTLLCNGIDTEQYRRTKPREAAKAAWGLPQNATVLGAVGRLSAEKRFDWLIESVRRLRATGVDAWGLIVGDGEERAPLEQVIRAAGLESFVRLAGFMDDVQPAFEAMDIYCLSSIREGMPNVLLEAMALELPVVATSLPGVLSIVNDGHEGLVVPPDDFEAFLRAVERLVKDQPLRERLAAAARKKVETQFSFARRIETIAQTYDELLGNTVGRCHAG